MLSNTYPEREGISPGELFSLKKWLKIQHLLSQILGANISLFDSAGSRLLPPSQVTGFCSNFVRPVEPTLAPDSECILKAFHRCSTTNENDYLCTHKMSFAAAKLENNEKVLGVILIGPVLIGRREKTQAYRLQCEEQGIDPDLFCDRVLEINVFSHQKIRTIKTLCNELAVELISMQALQKQPLLKGQLSQDFS